MKDADLNDSVETEESASARHDFQPKNAAKRGRKKREPKVRHDSPAISVSAVDGWGEPFDVKCSPGFTHHWASEHDLTRPGGRRWTVANWGDPRVVSYSGTLPGVKGSPIKYRELTLMIMTSEDAAAARQRDPRRVARESLRETIYAQARASRGGRVENISKLV